MLKPYDINYNYKADLILIAAALSVSENRTCETRREMPA